MTHELIMLRAVAQMKQRALNLTKEARSKAIKSYCTTNCRGGTLKQMQEVCRRIAMRDECLLFCNVVKQALNLIPDGYAALLKKVYIKRVGRCEICAKYRVSRTSFYRELKTARDLFKAALARLDCTESWFLSVFGGSNLTIIRRCEQL